MKQTPKPALTQGTELMLQPLTEDEIEAIDLPKVCLYIEQVLHNPLSLGYPDPTDDFSSLGFSLQPINPTTARVLLVINHQPVLDVLAKYAWCYEQMGYNLLIDEHTIVREYLPRTSTAQRESVEKSIANSIEVV